MLENVKKFLHLNPKWKKVVGVILIFWGVLALFTPLTPGSWLAFLGLELLGIKLLFLEKIKERFMKK